MTPEEIAKWKQVQYKGMQNLRLTEDEVTIQQYDNQKPRWYEISSNFYAFILAVCGIGLAALITWTLTIDAARTAERQSIEHQKASTATTLDLCAVRLPMMAGRMVKTEGEVLFWKSNGDRSLDLYLTRELLEGRGACSIIAHLPPTVPETTWIPVSGERVQVCGLMIRSNSQARMSPGWRCL